tara:strand:+ start:4027 stop:6420 length:2394 start_codon:yes stop_codon:yes gene_type:complete
MEHFPKPLDAMRAFNQFVLWKAVASKSRPGKFDKFPCNIEGNIVDAHNPAYWNDADTALTVSNLLGEQYGVGFVFTENDPFFFVDVDGAYDGTKWNDIATELCTTFAGCAIEVSHSGRGLHIFGQYSGDAPEHGCKNIPLSLEFYTSGRFVAMTGNAMTGDSSFNCDNVLPSVIAKHYPVSTAEQTSQEWTTTHNVNSNPITSDEKLIEKALKSSAKKDGEMIFGGKSRNASFKDLYECNVESLANTYPDEIREFDASSADAALAQHLAFWTGGNCERIERLMRGSALVREKWNYHKSYMERTIIGACARQSDYYNVGAPIEIVDTSILIEPVYRDGYQLLSASQQVDLFKGCVYIAEINKIFTPNGSMMKSEQFNSMYGGYNFIIDNDGEKTTKKAWEAFTESQCLHNPKVDSMTFRPDVAPHSIIEADGWRYVNTYVPIEIETVEGDVTPFKTHLSKVLPDERDQTILLSYMAACVQYKGYKIQWAPLLQGVVGNGKTLFTRCVAYAIGERYTHMPPALEISEKFNAWLFNTMFIGVEDIYVPSNKLEMIETLKPMITNKRLARRAMNTDQAMHNICCNFMFNSNHKDGIKDATKDRRYCVFYSAQQEKIDLIRDGMDGKYFSDLYLWLDKNKGYAKVAQFLNDYKIPDEFNPTMSCQTAPTTSSTAEAATIGMGSVEQEVIEAIEEGRTGFAGGWVSSFALDKLIDLMRKGNQVPRNKRRELMRSLGYDYHPGLKDGRVNNIIAIENGKPRLYIKAGHVSSNFTSGAEIARQYAAAQGDVLAGAASVDNSVKSV